MIVIKNLDEYKQCISDIMKSDSSEAEKLAAIKQLQEGTVPDDDVVKDWYCVAGFGSEGYEMLVCEESQQAISETLFCMKMRARYNTQRNIKLWAWIDDHKVSVEEVIDRRDEIETNAYQVF